MSNSLFSLSRHSCVLSSSGKLKLVEWGSGERNKKQGGSGYEAGTYFRALDVSEKYLSQIHWPLEHLEIAVAFRRFNHGDLCSVACMCIYSVCLCIYICTYYFCQYLMC